MKDLILNTVVDKVKFFKFNQSCVCLNVSKNNLFTALYTPDEVFCVY